ncbi:unnamed protein product [Nezara viridula]|uniref:Uncharacterized protein n=1 Tax=Nezara viridula TaxID=85310 RepID=A0A9P0H9S1_NEZVI|nr:unnamed protein product [Nezara viridula]
MLAEPAKNGEVKGSPELVKNKCAITISLSPVLSTPGFSLSFPPHFPLSFSFPSPFRKFEKISLRIIRTSVPSSGKSPVFSNLCCFIVKHGVYMRSDNRQPSPQRLPIRSAAVGHGMGKAGCYLRTN